MRSIQHSERVHEWKQAQARCRLASSGTREEPGTLTQGAPVFTAPINYFSSRATGTARTRRMGRSPLALALLGVAAAHGSPHPRRSGHGGALLFAPAALPRGPGHARRPSLCGDPLGSSSARQHARTREPALGPALQLARGRYGPRWQSVATHMLSADDSESARAAKLDLRFYDLVERSERNVDQIERAEVLLKTGFELDGTILRNQQGERVDPETLRGTSVGKSF